MEEKEMINAAIKIRQGCMNRQYTCDCPLFNEKRGECSLVLDRPRDWKLPEQESIWHNYLYEKPKESGFYLTADVSGSIHEKFYDANRRAFLYYYPFTTRENFTVRTIDTVMYWREMIKYGE